MIDNKIFAGGGLNFDDDYHLMPKNDWLDARNLRINSTTGGYLGAFSAIKGTDDVYTITFPSGSYQSVGARGFDNVGKIFIFLALVEGVEPDSKIIMWDEATQTGTILVDNTDSDSTDILNFNIGRRINHIDLIDEKYLYWVESADDSPVNPPRMLDITKNYGTITRQSLSVIKQPPLLPISNVKAIDCPGGGHNNIGSNAWYFKYRYVYWDNSVSSFSPMSAIGAQRSRGNATISSYAPKVFDSAIQFEFNGGGSLVKGVDVIAKENDNGDWKIIDSFDFQNNFYGKTVRLSYINNYYSNGDTITINITINGTLYAISPLSGVFGANPLFLEELNNAIIAAGIQNLVFVSYVPGDDVFGYISFTTKNPGDTITITSSEPTLINIVTLNNELSNLSATNTYTFVDGKRNLPVDQAEAISPFDYVPIYANAQCSPNGNYLAYGDYTEGYDNVDVSFNTTFIESTYANPSFGVTVIDIGSGDRSLQFSGTFVPTEQYAFIAKKTLNGSYWLSIPSYSTDTEASYLERIATYFRQVEGGANVDFDLALRRIILYGALTPVNAWEAEVCLRDSISIHKSDGQYKLSIAYIDEYGRFGAANSVSNNTINIPSQIFSQIGVSSSSYYIPYIQIDNLAPTWASKYAILRSKRANIGKFVTSPFDDTGVILTGDGLGKISIVQLTLTNTDFNQNINLDFVEGDKLILNTLGYGEIPLRIKEINTSNEVIFYQGSLSAEQASDVNSSLSTSWFQLVSNDVSNVDDVYYEVATIGNIVSRRHQAISAGDVTQTVSVPARIKLLNGDCFLRDVNIRRENEEIVEVNPREMNVFSDYNDASYAMNLGTPNIINPLEKQTRYPAAVRFGGAYVVGTSVNNINSFDTNSFKEFSLGFGPVQKLDIDGSIMIVGQRLRIGRSGIFESILLDKNDTETVAISEKLISDVTYYGYEAGIGDAPEAYVRWGSTKWGVDKLRGLVWRLSGNGITPISITAKANSYFSGKLKLAETVLSGFDPKNQEVYFTIFDGVANQTIVFNENNNRFTHFYEGLPTVWVTLYQDLYAFSGSYMWQLDKTTTYNNIFGVQKTRSVTLLGNDNPAIKKTFLAVSEIASDLFTAPAISTDLGQVSSLVSGNFKELEGEFHAAFLKDSTTRSGITNPLFNGPSLKGKWIKCKLENNNTNFVYLLSVGIKYIISPQTGV
jgi:hypothetical protein